MHFYHAGQQEESLLSGVFSRRNGKNGQLRKNQTVKRLFFCNYPKRINMDFFTDWRYNNYNWYT